MLAVIHQPGTVEIESEEMGDDRELLEAKDAQSWVDPAVRYLRVG
jgi:hypothetical protein